MKGIDIYSLIGVLVLCAAYAFAARIRGFSTGFKTRWASASAGVSLAYVFLDIMPELAERSHLIREAAMYAVNPAKRIYSITLLGILTFVALSFLRKSNEERGEHVQQVGDWYSLTHVGGFALYNILIGFLAVERGHVSIPSLCIYVCAMALHMVMIDTMLEEIYGSSYSRRGRKVLAFAVLLGWLLGVTGTLSQLTFSRLFAFLAGAIVITSASEEFPRGDQARLWYFVGGAALYASLLVLI